MTAKETEEEVARLKRLARKTHDVKLRQRHDIIRLFLCERAKRDIAAILDISLTQVYLMRIKGKTSEWQEQQQYDRRNGEEGPKESGPKKQIG